MQFLLDCSAMPNVIQYAQRNGQQLYNDIFYLSRTWCLSIQRENEASWTMELKVIFTNLVIGLGMPYKKCLHVPSL